MSFFKKCLGLFFMTLVIFSVCASIVPRNYLDNSQIIRIPVVIHLYKGQTFEDVEKSFTDSQNKLSKGKIELEIISIDHNAPELKIYDVNQPYILDEKSISDRDEYLHIFFAKKIIHSEKDKAVNGYHISWNKSETCSSFILISSSASTTTIAHEVGHELDLRHTKRKRRYQKNIMYPRAVRERVGFSRKQIVKMRVRALQRNNECKAKFQGLKI